MQDIKGKIKVAAAAVAGTLMLGATMAGAVAADLSGLPAPFVQNNQFQGQIVVGSGAAVADVIAAAQIAAAFGEYLVSGSASSTTTTTDKTYKMEELALNGVVSSVLGTQIKDNHVSKLLDKEISFRGESYDIHEEIRLGSSTPVLKTGLDDSDITGVRNADDYGSTVGSKVYMKVSEGDIEYRYVFDDTLNGTATATKIDSTHPLTLSLLGQSVKIVGITDADTITVQKGDEKLLYAGESMTVGSYTVKLSSVTETKAVVVVSGGDCSTPETKAIAEGNTVTFCDDNFEVSIATGDLVYVDTGSSENFATLTAGESLSDTVNDGDKFMSESDDTSDSDAMWKWRVNASGGVIRYIGAYYAQNTNDLGDEISQPITVGESLNLPYDYAAVKLVSYTTDERQTYTLKFDASEDLYTTASGTVTHNDVPVIIIEAGKDDAFTYSGTDSSKVAIYQTNSASNELLKVALYDADESKWIIQNTLTNATAGTDTGIDLTFGDTIYNLKVDGDKGAAAGGDADYNITLVENGGTETIKFVVKEGTSGGFVNLGNTEDDAEAWEVMVGTEKIGTSETDVLTHYGTIIKNPSNYGDSDKVVFEVPSEQVKVNVYVGPVDTTVSSTSSSVTLTKTAINSAVAVLDSEVTDGNTKPLVIVGGPYVNTLAQQIVTKDDAATYFGYDSATDSGKGVIEFKDDVAGLNGVDVLFVAGWKADDTRATAYALSQYLSGALDLNSLSGKTKVTLTASGPTTFTIDSTE